MYQNANLENSVAQGPFKKMVGAQHLENFDALEAGIVFTGWIGKNPMSIDRANAAQSVIQKCCRPVVFITDETLNDWVVPEVPIHPAYPYLSEVHKADYMRVYMLHHFGGGYTDIKPPTHSWTPIIERFIDSGKLILGYPELSADSVAQLPGEVGLQLRAHYRELIGVCSIVCRRKSKITQEWFDRTNTYLDKHLEALRVNPARHPMDRLGAQFTDGTISQYPLAWTGVGGNHFHETLLSYREEILQDDAIRPQLHSYR